jgi:hypothetical protein
MTAAIGLPLKKREGTRKTRRPELKENKREKLAERVGLSQALFV